MIHGINLIVSIEGVAIACAKACQIELSLQFIQACSPTDSQVLEKIPTTYDWSVSADGLIPASSLTVGLEDKLIKGTKCFLTFTDGSGNQRAGFVYVKSCRQSGPVGSLATYSVSFESTGALYKYAEYSANSFTEGIGVKISVSNDAVTYEFNQSSHSALGIGIANSINAYLSINYHGSAFVVYDLSFTEVKSSLTNRNTSYLDAHTVKFGSSINYPTLIPITNGLYTVLFSSIGSSSGRIFRLTP